MSKAAKMMVWAQDDESKDVISSFPSVRMRKPRPEAAREKNVFVLTTLTGLSHVTDFVRDANQHHRLRALLIREDTDTKVLPQLMDRANVRTLRNTLVHSGHDVPRRVLMAWQQNAQHELIATAYVVGDFLMAISCALDVIEVPFDATSALRSIPDKERSHFTISSEGSYIHWPQPDVHLDLDALRCAIDPGYREQRAAEALLYDRRFGEAVAALRKAHGLRQSDISGISERQVRRIEQGERPTSRAIGILAENHGLSAKEYLEAVAEWFTRHGS
jgi:hypothetical protein